MKYYNIKPIEKSFKKGVKRALSLSKITRKELMESRDHRHVMWRQALYYMLRQEGHTYVKIALLFNRDHSTIQHACKKFADRLTVDLEVDKIYNDLTNGSSNYI